MGISGIGAFVDRCHNMYNAFWNPIAKSIKIELQSTRSVREPSSIASKQEDARIAMQKAGYNIGDKALTRKLDPNTGEGFWDITINDCRMVCYGPGEYVQPHYHDIDETFDIKAGGCHVWLSQDSGATWSYNYCGKGELRIPGKAWHCLVAGDEGLCMDVYKDSKRTINWLDAEHSPAWFPTLAYTVTIQELKEATQVALGF